MTMSNEPTFPATVHDVGAKILAADGTDKIVLFSGNTNGSRIKSISFCTDDPVEVNVQIWKTITAIDYLLGTVNVPAGSGNSKILPAVDGLNRLSLPWLREDCIMVGSASTVKISAIATLTSGKTLYALAEGGDY